MRPSSDNSQAGVVTFAQAFREGDVPDTVVAVLNDETLPTQVDVKRTHPDGSVRHAVVSVQVPAVSAGEALTLELRSAEATDPSSGASVSDLLAGGFDMQVSITEGGETFTTSAKELLETASPSRWLNGPLVTELRVSGPLVGTSGDHPALQVLFDLRFVGPDGARASITIENAFDDTPGNLTYDVAITDPNSNVLYEAAAVQHFHHARWRHVASWGAGPPAVDVAHDLDYLIEVGVVPRYDTSRTVPQSSTDSLVTAWEASDRRLASESSRSTSPPPGVAATLARCPSGRRSL